MRKTLINARFFVVSPNLSIKPLAKTSASAFQYFYKQF